MFCKKCGKELKNGSEFCANCGTPVVTNKSVAEPKKNSSVQEPKKSSLLPVIIILFIVLIIIIGAVVAIMMIKSDEKRLESKAEKSKSEKEIKEDKDSTKDKKMHLGTDKDGEASVKEISKDSKSKISNDTVKEMFEEFVAGNTTVHYDDSKVMKYGNSYAENGTEDFYFQELLDTVLAYDWSGDDGMEGILNVSYAYADWDGDGTDEVFLCVKDFNQWNDNGRYEAWSGYDEMVVLKAAEDKFDVISTAAGIWLSIGYIYGQDGMFYSNTMDEVTINRLNKDGSVEELYGSTGGEYECQSVDCAFPYIDSSDGYQEANLKRDSYPFNCNYNVVYNFTKSKTGIEMLPLDLEFYDVSEDYWESPVILKDDNINPKTKGDKIVFSKNDADKLSSYEIDAYRDVLINETYLNEIIPAGPVEFALYDINGSGCKDLIIKAPVGVRHAEDVLIYIDGKDYCQSFTSFSLFRASDKGICIGGTDYEGGGEVYIYMEFIYRIGLYSHEEVASKEEITVNDYTNNYGYEDGISYSDGKDNSISKAEFEDIYNSFDFEEIDFHEVTESNINKYVK